MTTTQRLQHQAYHYSSAGQLLDAVAGFVEEGLEDGEPSMVALPEPMLDQVRCLLRKRRATAERVLDMSELGRNPARIISAIRDFVDAHPGRRTRMIGEPIWPGRTPSEQAEAARHEALINMAFAGEDITIVCPYDTALDGAALVCSHRTHPEVIRDGACEASDAYAPDSVGALDADPLPPPPAAAATLLSAGDLGKLRHWLGPHLEAAGLTGDRADDLTVAVNEAAGNALLHGGAPADTRVWREPGGVVCEVTDGGRIDDPLVGRQRPPAEAINGRGLWLANQLCDLTQLRSGDDGTVLRLHMSVPG